LGFGKFSYIPPEACKKFPNPIITVINGNYQYRYWCLCMSDIKINKKTSKIEIEPGSNILPLSRKKIEQLNNNCFFKYKSTNFYGRYLTHYLFNLSLFDLSNSEPLNPQKNTYPKIMNWLKIVDSAIDKPLDKVQRTDLENFIQDFLSGKIQSRNPNKANVARSVRFYVQNYQRLIKVMIEYKEQNESDFDYKTYRWVDKIHTPKSKKKHYEKFPHLTINQLLKFANNFELDEYKIRVLISVNLLGRACEIAELRYEDIQRKDGSLWIQLPEIKAHSYEKVPIELWGFVRKEFDKFLEKHDFAPNDKIFQKTTEAFAKQLKRVSNVWFNDREDPRFKDLDNDLKKKAERGIYSLDFAERQQQSRNNPDKDYSEIRDGKITSKITPKSFRKIGLGIAEELGYSRADCERLGGWASNSPVLNHYFSRKAVKASQKSDEVTKTLDKDLSIELERQKAKNRELEKKLDYVMDFITTEDGRLIPNLLGDLDSEPTK